jgi:hypothetical protein
MSDPIRYRRSRAKGSRLPPGVVCVDRTTAWGNCFVVGRDGAAEVCVLKHKTVVCSSELFADFDPAAQRKMRDHFQANIEGMRGKSVACWCPLDAPCHGDTILRCANA